MKVLLRTIIFVLAVALTTQSISAQSYEISADSVFKHVSVLAADSMEGRETGEIGEWKAAQYIVGVFRDLGLEPKGDNGTYFQSFDFIKRIEPGPRNKLTVNGIELQLNEEFKPMLQSADAEFAFDEIVPVGFGITVNDSTYDDYAGKDISGRAVLIKRYGPPKDDYPDVDFDRYSAITDKVMTAIDHDVTGIFFVTPEDQDDTIMTRGFTHITPKDIPIVWLRRKGLEKLGLNLTDPELLSAYGETELVRVRDTGYNVIAYLPANNDTTIMLGAHYDHLGWGGPASRYLGPEKLIHPGADDNGSGSAALLELARYYSSRRSELNHSLLFLALSGEEKGILGSSHFVRNMTVDSTAVRMMINMDMIGRLATQEKGLAIMGTGTCEEFKAYFDSLETDGLKLAFKESGAGPSDHTAFYSREIPVLMFFTGAHEDYHKPEDVAEKIDSDGIVRVADLVSDIVSHFDRYDGPLTFRKTKDDDDGRRRAAFSVTLGVMPDHVSEVRGMRVDNVAPGRPADAAGMQSGDIIIKMGEYEVDDIYTYMSCLGKFRKGDTTTVMVQRDVDTLSLEVIFK